MSFVVKVVQSPDVLNSTRSTQFHREIEGLVEAGVKIVLLDLKNVTSISSSGLMALVVAFRVVRAAGGKLFICSMSEQVRMLFELTGVDQVFESFANLDEFKKTAIRKKILAHKASESKDRAYSKGSLNDKFLLKIE